MKEPKRVLFVNSEIFPYLPESEISLIGRYLPQGIQESGKEIRSFMPRYGCINERRNQLHEVIRLSGMNIVVNDIDRPLVIKVSSISAARMQVYFIDNEDYFHRKFIYTDAEGNLFADNDERAAFFARGILETVKKLRWKPDVIHCQGWISHFLPIYLKKAYSDDPIFSDSKVVLTLYNELLDQTFSPDIIEKVTMHGVKAKNLEILSTPNGINLAKLAIQYADGIIMGEENVNQELVDYVNEYKLPILPYEKFDHTDTGSIQRYNTFYDQFIKSSSDVE
ncbi:MAG: glycogen/starch synthase [Bacteroidales bacterium]|nr:glycogen/starch synthase [Bacteroidales bacterium]